MEMWVIATLVLVAGLVDDMRSRKVHNALILTLAPLVLVTSLYFKDTSGVLIGLLAMLLALVVTIPLFSLGILGGGDVKLFALFAMAVDPMTAFWTLIYSFVWGSLFGVTRSMLQKQLLALVRNTYKLATRQRVQAQELQMIPYTFAFLLGWFTHLTILRAGGGL